MSTFRAEFELEVQQGQDDPAHTYQWAMQNGGLTSVSLTSVQVLDLGSGVPSLGMDRLDGEVTLTPITAVNALAGEDRPLIYCVDAPGAQSQVVVGTSKSDLIDTGTAAKTLDATLRIFQGNIVVDFPGPVVIPAGKGVVFHTVEQVVPVRILVALVWTG